MNKVPQRILTALLISVCLMCAGCDEVADESEQETDTTPASQSEKTVTDCKGYDYSRLRECRINLHDGRQVTCLILSGDIRSGMSCDWANATEEADK